MAAACIRGAMLQGVGLRMRKVWAITAITLLAACNSSQAPADKLEKAAEDIVENASGELPPAPLAEGPFAPRDECSDLDGAREFRERLAAAVKGRDTDTLVALASEDVKLDFDGGRGRAELRHRLGAEGSDLWAQLDELMSLGCDGDRQKGMTLPWYFAQEIPGDPEDTAIVAGESVPVLARPAEGAKVVDYMSWEAVTLTGEDSGEGASADAPGEYRQVALPEDLTGYIARNRLRPVLDYRLQAISRNGKWSITSIVAGE